MDFPNAIALNHKSTVHKSKKLKRRQYEEWSLNVERGTFTPLIFSAIGSAASTATEFLKWLEDQICRRHHRAHRH